MNIRDSGPAPMQGSVPLKGLPTLKVSKDNYSIHESVRVPKEIIAEDDGLQYKNNLEEIFNIIKKDFETTQKGDSGKLKELSKQVRKLENTVIEFNNYVKVNKIYGWEPASDLQDPCNNLIEQIKEKMKSSEK